MDEILYVCYDIYTKKCIAISRDSSLIWKYISNNQLKNCDVIEIEGENFIEKYEVAFDTLELEEYGDNVMTAKEKYILLDMIKEDVYNIKNTSREILKLVANLNFNDKEKKKLMKAYQLLQEVSKPSEIRRLLDLDTLYKDAKVKKMVDLERELRREIDDDGTIDGPLIIFI